MHAHGEPNIAGSSVLPPERPQGTQSDADAEEAQRPGKSHRCRVCDRTYERRDHLSRHVKTHSETRSHICQHCGKGFTRGDLLSRHHVVHLKGSNDENLRRRTARACKACISAKTKCTEERPCARCTSRNEPCLRTQARGQPLAEEGMSANEAPASVSTTMDSIVEDNSQLTPPDTHDGGMFEPQNPVSFGGVELLDEFAFPDFFDHIMNMPSGSYQDQAFAPPNVFNFTSDDFGTMDYDFALLAGGFTRPNTAYGTRHAPEDPAAATTTPQSDAQLRSDAFERSPWSWHHWIPTKSHSTFSGQEINVTEQRVSTIDHSTPEGGLNPAISLELEARDRILRLVTSVADSRLTISSFPSPELLSDLINVFVLQERDALDSYIHWPSLNCREMVAVTLLGMLAKGATFVALQPVWQIGLVFQEIVRLAVGDMFERDNSTTRQLQPLQAYLLHLDVGLWSGFRRKTEIASSFLQPAMTMLSWSDAFMKSRYRNHAPLVDDDTATNESKWRLFVEEESLKRLVLHAYIHDSQASLAHTRNPLLSPSQMQLPMPLSTALWQAPDAESWRAHYLSTGVPEVKSVPSVVTIPSDIQMLQKFGPRVDQKLCILLACHMTAYDVLQYRQQAIVFASTPNDTRRDRWLAHKSRQKEIYEDLHTMHTYCEMGEHPLPEALLLLHYLMMLLHTPFDDIQLFSGRSGETEARRVYPSIKIWTTSMESRTAIWHAGQTLRVARTFDNSKLRDFYAVAVHHVALTLWVYGMVTSNIAKMSRAQSPAGDNTLGAVANLNNEQADQHVDTLVDDEDSRQAKAFRLLGTGRPCLGKLHGRQDRSGLDAGSGSALARACPLESPREIILLVSQVLEDNFPNSCSGLPPLVDNLVKLMVELSRFSGRDT